MCPLANKCTKKRFCIQTHIHNELLFGLGEKMNMGDILPCQISQVLIFIWGQKKKVTIIAERKMVVLPQAVREDVTHTQRNNVQREQSVKFQSDWKNLSSGTGTQHGEEKRY